MYLFDINANEGESEENKKQFMSASYHVYASKILRRRI